MEHLTEETLTLIMFTFGFAMLALAFTGCHILESSYAFAQKMKDIRRKYHSRIMSDQDFRVYEKEFGTKSIIERDIIDLDALFKDT